MEFLYKRFFIIALVIANMGILTAKLIVETRTDKITYTSDKPFKKLTNRCGPNQLCFSKVEQHQFTSIG